MRCSQRGSSQSRGVCVCEFTCRRKLGSFPFPMPWTQEEGGPHPRKGDAAKESRTAAAGGDPTEVKPAGKWQPERGKCELQTQLHCDSQKVLNSAGSSPGPDVLLLLLLFLLLLAQSHQGVAEGEIVIIGGQRFKQEGGTFINLDVSKDEVTSTAHTCPQSGGCHQHPSDGRCGRTST